MNESTGFVDFVSLLDGSSDVPQLVSSPSDSNSSEEQVQGELIPTNTPSSFGADLSPSPTDLEIRDTLDTFFSPDWILQQYDSAFAAAGLSFASDSVPVQLMTAGESDEVGKMKDPNTLGLSQGVNPNLLVLNPS